MLREVGFLKNALPLILHHHERWDGTGYPYGLKGEAIPLAARLFAVVDAYDAITSDRPYRAAASHEEAMEILWKDAGTHFDMSIVLAFQNMMNSRLQHGAAADTRTESPGAFSHFAAGA